MSHIVIHDDGAGVTQYRRFDEIGDAIAYIEQLHNVDGVTDARLFALHEVALSVRSYVKVEIGDEADSGVEAARVADGPAAAEAVTDDTWSGTAGTEPEADDEAWTDGDAWNDDVEYVDASAMSDEPVVGPEPDDIPDLVSEPRRGLFGR